MTKTKKEFLNKYASNPELARKVFNQMSASWKEIIKYPEDFRDAGAGVGGFIYYNETVPFAKQNMTLITRALHEFEQEIGMPLKKPTDDETQYLNWLAWFALENTIDDVIQYKESDIDMYPKYVTPNTKTKFNPGWKKNVWGV